MLVTLQQTGDFEIRTPRIEYKFNTILGEIATPYLDYCATIRKYAATSISNRKTAMFRFDVYLSNNKKSIEDTSNELFEDFLMKHCSRYGRRHYKVFFRDIFKYCFDNGILNKDYSSLILKEPRVALGSNLPTTYTADEIKRIIKAVDRSSAKGKRDYLILLLAAEYGWRASDITSFRIDEIDWSKNIISIIQTKTGIPVEFPLLASVGNAIIDYLKYGRPDGGDNVIIVNHENTHKGNRLTSPTIHSIVSKAMKLANIPNWKTKKHGPHALRHSLASNMLKRNISIPIIKTVLGHQNTQSTKTYLTVDIQKLKLCSLPIPQLTSEFYNPIKKK
jgi:site-specific recombinase XerD